VKKLAAAALGYCLALSVLDAPAVFAAGVLFKCREADGKVILRDKSCRRGERELARTRPGDVSRQFTIIAPHPAGDSFPAGAAVPAPVAGDGAAPAAKP
jgi:hypothetical protein